MTINAALAPESAASASQPRAQVPVVSSAGVNDLAAIARQQLPSAVPAVTQLAAYHANVQPQPKPPARTNIGPPSSALAAQFIAQDAVATPEELQIFEARPAGLSASADAPQNDFLRDLRVARGEVEALKKTPDKPPPAEAQTTAPSTLAKTASLAPPDQPLRASLSGLPTLLTPLIKRPTLLSARGIGAYQLATQRHAGQKLALGTH